MGVASLIVDPFFWENWVSDRSGAILHSLAVDVVTMLAITFGVYYRRHRRSDLVLAFMALNVGLFAVGVLIVNQAQVGMGFGFGLFAILSIVRLRSDQVAHQEVAYYVVALVIGLLNGMTFHDRWLVNLLNIAVVVLMALLDNGVVLPNSQRQLVTLDTVHATEDDLRADLEARMNCKVLHVIVQQVDYVRETMLVDVRLRPLPAEAARPRRIDGQRVAEARAAQAPEALESL
ncbi:DUF4956 domain-containing protein [Nocardioides phosphati]|uniref:DUF4956 domain-containing protein n=1 Tax=Nocardioides phosphati TaxID=1867775 RepID=A0ABQ2NDD5_9ACTN|nr:DUF4956 domain-containing protein [Nocardioides phosphati]GGO93712.1 DUF4956 domain-containing protein [Nocardioides phosphati]